MRGAISTARTLSRLRNDNGYRHFRNQDIHKLNFLGRARALGFTIKDCRTLLALYEDESRASADVKRLARNHLAQIDAKIVDLKGMRKTSAISSTPAPGMTVQIARF